MAVPIKAKDAVPTITNFNIVSPAAHLLQVNPQLTRTVITRQLAEPRPAIARSSFLTDVAEIARSLEDWVAASLRDAAALEMYFKPASEDQRENPAGPRHVGAIIVAEGFQHHSLFPGNAAEKQDPKTDQARATGNPVRQQQCLSDSPQPKR